MSHLLLIRFCNNPTGVVCPVDAFLIILPMLFIPVLMTFCNNHRIDVVSYADDVL